MRLNLTILSTISIVLFQSIMLGAAHAGQPGLPFLRLNMDARAAASGGTGIAFGNGLRALQLNPAGLVRESLNEFYFTHRRGFDDTDSEFIGFLWKRNKRQAIAVSLFSNNINDIEARSGPSIRPDGFISAHDFYAGLTYSMNLKPGILVGTSVKYAYQKLYVYDASGILWDFGMQYVPETHNYAFGLVLKNLGSMGALRDEKPDVPTFLRVGVSYRLKPFADGNHLFEFSGDYESLFDGEEHLHLGLNYRFNLNYHIGLGYISGYESGRISAGCGLTVRRYGFDYAYMPDITPFSNQHIMTFRMSF